MIELLKKTWHWLLGLLVIGVFAAELPMGSSIALNTNITTSTQIVSTTLRDLKKDATINSSIDAYVAKIADAENAYYISHGKYWQGFSDTKWDAIGISDSDQQQFKIVTDEYQYPDGTAGYKLTVSLKANGATIFKTYGYGKEAAQLSSDWHE